MTDPFRDLREAIVAVGPDPAFASALRARVERALALPRGVIPVTAPEQRPTTPRADSPRPAAVPYLAVRNAVEAIGWYVDVLGAGVLGDPYVMPDGRIGHAELEIGGGVLYLADEHPEIGVVAPEPAGASVSLMLPVGDADAVRERAMSRGATGDRPPYDGYGSRTAWIVDPFGHRWGLTSPLRVDASAGYRPGDVAYVSIRTPDAARAQAFYEDVLGWRFDAADTGELEVPGAVPATGLSTGASAATLVCCYAVADLDGALDRVRAAGGSAGAVDDRAHGRTTDCVDDQGTEFALVQADLDAEPREGALSYLTLHVVDTTRARAFYASVLGWEFTPGRVDDGWEVSGGVAPMIGFHGGHERAEAVPMWETQDIATAAAKVRELGGTATDPERQPYGITSECVDDQGSRFYLGEF